MSRALAVSPSLLGAAHTWQMDGAKVEVLLPTRERIERDRDDFDPIGRLTTQLTDGTPLEYLINQVDVRVYAGKIVDLPAEVLSRNPNAFDLIPEETRRTLEATSGSHHRIARESLEYWLSVLRWVCDDYRIGRHEVQDNESGWTTYLHDSETGKKVWGAGHHLVVASEHRVTNEEWAKAQSLLSELAPVPIHVAQFQEAQALFALGDFRRCTVDLCIAVEIYLRQKIWEGLPVDLGSDVRSYIEQANINHYLNKFFPYLLNATSRATYDHDIKKSLKELFVCRNRVMHQGMGDIATRGGCEVYLWAARSLFCLLS